MEHVAVGGGDAEILVLKIGQRLGHQDCAGEQDQRQRSLKDDQRFLRQRGAITGGAVDAAQRFGRLSMRRHPGGRDAEQDAGHQRNQKCKTEHSERWAGIDGQVARIRECKSENGVRSGIGNGQPGKAADATQQHALCKNLANDAAASRAQRHAHRDIRAARRAARQHQVGNIRAGDEQHDDGQNHQHLQTLAGLLLQALDAAAAG